MSADALKRIEDERSTTPTDLLRLAVSQGADIDKLAKLMDLQERWEKNEARKAYTAAMKSFKADPPVILKNQPVSYTASNGQTIKYRHATLDHICAEVTAALSKVGITHAWRVKQENSVIMVSCVLTHELGHSEETQLSGLADTSGGKNAIQAIGSTVTYLQRYTLFAACGLAASNDDDGRGGNSKAMDEAAIEEYLRQINDIETLDDLKAVYTKAYGEAQALNDQHSMRALAAAKNKRKAELHKVS